MKFQNILKSKPHNEHYLNRYIKFISYCQEINLITSEDYVEKHHICPKASDLFPEFKDLRIHTWNKINLTARQHFIAHHLLWKCYPVLSTYMAFKIFINGAKTNKHNRPSYKVTSKTYELLKTANCGGYRKNSINVYDTVTGLSSSMSSIDYYDLDKPQNIISQKTGKVWVRDLNTGKTATMSSIDYKNSGDNIVSANKGRMNPVTNILAFDKEKGLFVKITKYEYENNNNFESASKNKVSVKNIFTDKITQISIDEFTSIDKPINLVGTSWKGSVSDVKTRKVYNTKYFINRMIKHNYNGTLHLII